ncbi:Erv1 / Alr family protein [Ancylostoma ceylanicum]|nr:Erv1 / Alr family protein [Ancylostoma ceylanicum]
MSVYYPEKPNEDNKKTASQFMDSLAKTYPCDFCAKDLRKDLKEDPPKLGSREEFAMWMCRLHNKVNKKTGKPEFDCSKVFERWRDGWKDGSCDY